MKFANIYKETEENMRLALLSLWAPGSHPMRPAIEELFDREPLLAEPVFQSTFGWEPSTDESWRASVNQDVWNSLENMRRQEAENANKRFRPFDPFKHQAESWNTLNEGRSIVVTSGTGSGKTECFMYPVLSDLFQQEHDNSIKAIFLYPLNALMEDQKKRLSKYCGATGLHFAVYNGDTQEYRANGTPLPNEVATREAIRDSRNNGTRPEILLTNPSMLEYILVRQKDQQMIQESAGKLRWIVIDEAHSYSGSAAVELGYQIKRIMDAFEVTPDQVRFACTSATIGGEEGAQSLAEYISTITGQSVDRIKVIGGKRLVPSLDETCLRNELEANNLPTLDRVLSLREKINNVSGMTLQQMWEHLCPDVQFDRDQILPALNLLDKLCEMEQDGIPVLSLRGHYFMRAIGGLYACANENCSGANSSIPLYGHLTTYKSSVCPECQKTLLEIVQCKNCGGFVLMGCSDSQTHKIVFCEDGTTSEDYFAIDLSPEQEDEEEQTTQGYPDTFFLMPYERETFFNPLSRANFETLDIEHGPLESKLVVNGNDNGKWVEVRVDDGHSYCPACGRLAQGKRLNFKHFRVPIDFINQAISPVLLSECAPNGQTWGKYIAFTDSRQATAISAKTFNINVERIQGREKMLQDLANSENLGMQNINFAGIPEDLIQQLIANNPNLIQSQGLSLYDVNNCIYTDQLFEHIAEDNNADKNAYKAALMRQIIGRKPIYENNAENMGLITLVYPALNNILQLPSSLSDYNDTYGTTINVDDWRCFLKLCLDYVFRVGNHIQPLIEGERSYVRDSNLSTPISAFNDIRQGISHWPILDIDENGSVQVKQNRLILLLCAGLRIFNLQDLQDRRKYVCSIMEAAWQALVDNHIITKVEANDDFGYNDNRYYQDHRFVGCYYLDLSARENNDVCKVKLAKEVKVCPFTHKLIDSTFCGYSPMINGEITERLFERYKCSDGIIKMPIRPRDNNEVDDWAQTNPEIQFLKDNGFWSDRHKYSYKKLHVYMAAEHSAQQSKRRLKEYTERFAQENPSINVLHCSTTMEMGVDIGDIDVVLMDTVPPTAANYLQRVGRAGRMGQSKSVAFSLCSNTPVGQHAFANPMWALETANLMGKVRRSQTIIQRHINSYFFRQFICRNGAGIHANLTVSDFMTNICDDFVNFLDKMSTNVTVMANFHSVFGSDQSFTINVTMNAIQEIKNEYDGIIMELNDAFTQFDDDNRRRMAIFNQIRKSESENLLTYLSEHQFIPNANMPTGVVTFDFTDLSQSTKLNGLYNSAESIKERIATATDDIEAYGLKLELNTINYEIEEIKKDTEASRDIHTALNEYAPGQTVVVNERNYVSAGIRFFGAYNQETQTRAIYHCTHCGHTDYRRNLDEGLSCPICGNPYHSIIDPEHSSFTLAYEPAAFCTDRSTTSTREERTEKNYYEIRPVLLKTDWETHNDINMCECVSSGESGNILFYNVGHGHGFAFCKRCGRAAVESYRGTSNDTIPYSVRTGHKKLWGGGCEANPNDIARHVVFTGNHPTCYSVLRFKKDPESTEYETDEQLVYSLGVVLRRALAKSEGIDEGEIDFGIKQEPNARVLFIYDTAKGGCGYSLKLENPVLCQEVFDLARQMLEETTCDCHIEDNGEGGACTRCLVDRSNYRYSHLLSKAKALNWLNMQKCRPVTVPHAVQTVSQDAKVVYQSLKEIVKQAIKDPEVKKITMCVSDTTDDYVISHWRSICSEMGKNINKAVSVGKRVAIAVEYHPELHASLPDKLPFINLNDKFADCEVSLIKDMGDIKTAVIVEYDDDHQRRYFTDSDSALSFSNDWGKACNVYADNESIVFETQEEPTYEYSPNRIVLDGFTTSTMFPVGSYFSRAIARDILKQEDIDMIREIIGNKHVNITFSDKYVNSALASLMLVYLVEEMTHIFEFDIDNIVLQLNSPRRKCSNAQFGDYSKIHFDFPSKVEADEYTYNLFSNVIGVEPISSNDDAEHHRWLRLESKDGGKIEIRFDHSVSGGYESNRRYMDLDSLDGNVSVTRKNEDVLYYIIIDKGSK